MPTSVLGTFYEAMRTFLDEISKYLTTRSSGVEHPSDGNLLDRRGLSQDIDASAPTSMLVFRPKQNCSMPLLQENILCAAWALCF